MLEGKKTYIVGIGAMLSAVGAYLTGEIALSAAIQLVVTAILGMTIRDGIAKKQ